jgi:hypothetical protein
MRAGAIILVLLMLLPGCDSEPRPAADKSVALVVSGDTAGWITPCGCASNQSGGLLRRGSYLRSLRSSAPAIYVDAGGASGGTSDYHKVKFEAILAGEVLMGIAAHNIGRSEAAMGAEYLRHAARQSGVPFVSANARDRDGKPLFDAARIVEAGTRRIAIVGVLDPAHASGDISVDDPRRAISTALAGMSGKYDSLIVLGYGDEAMLEELAASLPEADAIIGGPTGQAVAPRRVGPALLASATNKGKFLVQLRHASNWSAKVVEMNNDFIDDPAQLDNLRKYLARLEQVDFRADQTGLAAPMPPNMPADYRIAGSASCMECHKTDDKLWHDSKHSHAIDVLRERGFHADPFCLSCHTTGYGLAGGFVSLKTSPQLTGVGCENCHGPSQAHVNDPKLKTPFAAADQCVRCHDHENSPKFVYSEYWKKIEHGQEKGVMPQAAGVRP